MDSCDLVQLFCFFGKLSQKKKIVQILGERRDLRYYVEIFKIFIEK